MIVENLNKIKSDIPEDVTLVAVSKTKPNSAIMAAYEVGQRAFGENKVQDLAAKAEALPDDIEWHMIGHLQTNKVKYIAPFVHLIHGVDSFKLLKEIDKRAQQQQRIIGCLLQVHIAEETSKFGLSVLDLQALLKESSSLKNIAIKGLMGMATNTSDASVLRKEFAFLKHTFAQFQSEHNELKILSMGMSGDYAIAIEEGSTMVRVGSAIFGSRL
ncbi:MAG: YggS family pyridoxal phosphate-dependent enzyme [Flavobacteriales bacterium]|jgi:pyridoxal phosphate enzyme (YggS family)|nr:YggS family pyridoxal phosphate-dependent enzyme [Flavobacteriales bacterium]